ncbi:unnamed protein product [Calypogeia fissa]
MEAITLGSKVVFSVKGQIKESIQTSPKRQNSFQRVKWVPASNQTGAKLFLSSSNFANVGMPSLTGKALVHRYRRTPSTTPQVVISFMNREKKSWSEMETSVYGEGKESDLISRLAKAATCVLAAGVLIFDTGLSAWADEMRVTFPASKISEVSTAQRTLVEAWGIIRETYVDSSFNNQDWDQILQDSLADTLSLTKSEDAYAKIRAMLGSLGDPFTRIITPQEYESFRINNDGALEGVGLLIASERETGRLIVMSPIEGGPADRAGIIPGDELVQIDDQVLTGLNGEEVATKLRGRAGTSVTLILRRNMVEEGAPNGVKPIEFKLQRETISLSPVYSTVLAHSAPDGRLMKTGYIRLSAFSQNAAREVERAISSLKKEGVGSYILDLRNNPGGLVKAGLDVAQMWLDGNEVLVNTIDREGYTQPVTLVNGHSLTRDPLVVLVNEGSASASEILAGALHDNGRAVLIGEKTYGKGKIQSVTELTDGSALFVTVAKYLSPGLHQIDHVGIAPDLKCTPEDLAGLTEQQGTQPAENEQPEFTTVEQQGIRRLQGDFCIMVAEHELDKTVSSS